MGGTGEVFTYISPNEGSFIHMLMVMHKSARIRLGLSCYSPFSKQWTRSDGHTGKIEIILHRSESKKESLNARNVDVMVDKIK